MKKEIEIYERKAAFAELKQFDIFSKEHDFIEVVEWHNGEGFDVEITGELKQRFQLTYGMFKAMKKLVKQLNKE